MNLIGQRFNRLIVIDSAERYVAPSGSKERQWKCKCDCGGMAVVTTSHLKSGHTKSCGCYAREMRLNKEVKHKKHGMTFDSNGEKSRIYRIWIQMKTRCYNKSDEHYKDYGGRGITVCDEWKNEFESFHEWAMSHGYEEQLTIDRINVNGNYDPSNCRWTTMKEQVRNRRNSIFITYAGTTRSLIEWSEITGIGYQTLFYRYKTGKTPSEILKI